MKIPGYPRTLPRAVLRYTRRQTTANLQRHLATAAQATERSTIDATTPPPPPPATRRREALHDAKPFSEFLTDTFHRQHDYLRISVTERCNLRCLYCMPEEGIQLSPNKDILNTVEIVYLSALFVNQGVTKIRLTGGEPTVRKDIVPLMQQIGSLRRNGLKELALTTNAISLHRKLEAMVEAGLTGVNISLDTLDPFQFQLLTRRQGFEAVMKSINRVQEMNNMGAGIKLKINCVVMRGLNDHQVLPFVEKTRDEDIEVRFIEYMPFDGNRWSQKKMLPYAEMVEMIRAKYPGLERLKGLKNDTSKTWKIAGFKGTIGFITSMTENFCGTCNRLRITSDGNLKVCLHGNAEVSLRDILREGGGGEPMDEAAFEAIRQVEINRWKDGNLRSDGEGGWVSKEQELLNVIGDAVKRKKAKHAGMGELENMKNRPMILIDEAGVYPTLRNRSSKPSLRRTHPYLRQQAERHHQIPYHILASLLGVPGIATRSYSTGASSRPEDAPTASGRDGDNSDNHTNFAFQSLSSLFAQRPAENRHTRPPPDRLERVQPDLPDSEDKEGADSPFNAEPDTVSSKNFASGAETRLDSPPVQALSLPSDPVLEAPSASTVLTASCGRDSPPPSQPEVDRNPLVHRYLALDKSPGTQHENDRDTIRGERVYSPQPVPNVLSHPSLRLAPRPKPKTPWGLASDSEQAGNLSESHPGASTDAVPPVIQGSSRLSAGITKEPVRNLRSLESGGMAVGEGSEKLTHVNSSGEAHMVDIGSKPATSRAAVAFAYVRFSHTEPFRLISEDKNKKGDVLGTARIAGIMAAKRTSDLIPLCHPIALTKVEVDLDLKAPLVRGPLWDNHYGIVAIHAHVECNGATGVEMEALCAVNGAALTVYDMCKAVDRHMKIHSACVVYKAGGKSGTHLISNWLDHGGRDFLRARGLPIPEARPTTRPTKGHKSAPV